MGRNSLERPNDARPHPASPPGEVSRTRVFQVTRHNTSFRLWRRVYRRKWLISRIWKRENVLQRLELGRLGPLGAASLIAE
jgi:hypothetical protein